MELYSSEHARLDAEIAVKFGKSGGTGTGRSDRAEEEEAPPGQRDQPAAGGQSCAEQSSQGVGEQEE